jgi:hypothetical protein
MVKSARKVVRYSLLVVGAAVVIAQFVPVNRTNPPVDQQQDFVVCMKPPAAVAAAIERSCRDCHTNRTIWPAYSRVAPISWLVADDVHEGRAHLNFSEWGKLDARRSARKLEDVCDEVKAGGMPLRKYTLLHPAAKLTEADVQAICRWTDEVASNPRPVAR